mgnify:CR=1 FL=1
MEKLTLKAARVNAGLTQAEAADKIGVSVQTIFNYEKGRAFPDVRVLKRIEDVYGIEYRNLIFLEDIPV